MVIGEFCTCATHFFGLMRRFQKDPEGYIGRRFQKVISATSNRGYKKDTAEDSILFLLQVNQRMKPLHKASECRKSVWQRSVHY